MVARSQAGQTVIGSWFLFLSGGLSFADFAVGFHDAVGEAWVVDVAAFDLVEILHLFRGEFERFRLRSGANPGFRSPGPESEGRSF